MIRKATFVDIPAVCGLIEKTHARSKYATSCPINSKAMHQLLSGIVAAQNQNGPGATFIVVSERLGKIQGFMAGSLSRVYNIGEKLVASDLFLINEGRDYSETQRMIDAYVGWAMANPKVIEVGLSWSDTVPRGQDAKLIYERRGFEMVGETYGMRIKKEPAKVAA